MIVNHPEAGSAETLAPGESVARYAETLLRACGRSSPVRPAASAPHPAVDWARSGAMAVTGETDGPPLLAPGPLAHCARGALAALVALAADGVAGSGHAPLVAGARDRATRSLREIDGPALLGERAAIAGLRRRGRVSPGGSCRLLRARDGWIALNLARSEDEALLPAWLADERRAGESAWSLAVRRAGGRRAAELVARARLMGLPVAPACPPREVPPPWLRIDRRTPPSPPGAGASPLVLDLSSLWAGPLCTHLLELAGARVIKLESTRRPDGARRGPSGFFDRLNTRKSAVALDFSRHDERALLSRLIARVDVVVESSRPRALAQLGFRAEELLASRPGLTWLSITGYGRREPEAEWTAFGDDAAVAAGLAVRTGSESVRPLFCGDAIADPLAGMHAAVAALAGFRSGGGVLLDIALRDVTEHALGWDAGERPGEPARVEAGPDRAGGALRAHRVLAGDEEQLVLEPRARDLDGRARPIGADTHSVLGQLLGRV